MLAHQEVCLFVCRMVAGEQDPQVIRAVRVGGIKMCPLWGHGAGNAAIASAAHVRPLTIMWLEATSLAKLFLHIIRNVGNTKYYTIKEILLKLKGVGTVKQLQMKI